MEGIRRGFKMNEKNGVRFLTVPSFEEAGGVVCAFSTRTGGVSPKPFDTLNFSLKREGNIDNFFENLTRFAAAAGFRADRAVAINYAHSARLHRAAASDAGRGITREKLAGICDGLYTDEEGLALVSFHADCVPLFFFDKKRRAAAVCHAGWRGIAAHITRNAVDSLVSLGSNAADILAAVGPCISAQNYEVGPEVSNVFISEFGAETVIETNESARVDLSAACVVDMLKCGIPARNITVAGLCTYEKSALFFSHRRDDGKTGAMAAVIELKKEGS